MYAKRMREKKYITMLDPIQKSFGQLATLLVYVASLWGDLFWTAAILSALGKFWFYDHSCKKRNEKSFVRRIKYFIRMLLIILFFQSHPLNV